MFLRAFAHGCVICKAAASGRRELRRRTAPGGPLGAQRWPREGLQGISPSCGSRGSRFPQQVQGHPGRPSTRVPVWGGLVPYGRAPCAALRPTTLRPTGPQGPAGSCHRLPSAALGTVSRPAPLDKAVSNILMDAEAVFGRPRGAGRGGDARHR